MLRTILVPLDGSAAAETVLPYVELIASRTDAFVHLITVVGKEAEAAQEGEAVAYLKQRSDELNSRGVSCAMDVVVGADPGVTVLAESESRGADLIAMSTHGRSGLARWVLGSVADKIVHRASRPLLLVRAVEDREKEAPRIERMLVPLDGSELSLSVLPYVEDLAGALGASLILYSGVLPLDVYPGSELTPARVGGVIDGLLEQGESFLGQVARDVQARGKVEARRVVTIGFPVDEVVRVAQETNAGLIAMATHGRSGLKRWVMGSVADGVVRRSSLPCLLVRPEQVPQEEE